MRKMKESGIDWIGTIPEVWDILPISMCFKERNEKVSDTEWEPLSVTKQGIVKQLENAAKSDAHDARKKVCKNDFVINSRSDRKQSCGVSQYDGSVSLINIVLENKKINPKFVNYLLKNYGFAEEFYRYGSGIVADLWSTNYQKMKKIMIPIPPQNEQEKIAEFLDKEIIEINNVIDKTKETIEDYKKYKISIIKEIFDEHIDEKTKYKKIGKMSSIVTKQTGFDYSNTIKPSLLNNPTENTIPYLQTRHFKDDNFNYETEFYIPIEIANNFPKILLNKKCLLSQLSVIGIMIGYDDLVTDIHGTKQRFKPFPGFFLFFFILRGKVDILKQIHPVKLMQLLFPTVFVGRTLQLKDSIFSNPVDRNGILNA